MDVESKKETVFMTTKRLISNEVFKKMEEYETIIESKDVGMGIFETLGLKLKENIKKSRESYGYKNSLIEIDVNEKTFVPLRTLFTFSIVPFTSKEIIPPKPFCCFFASSC